MGHLAGVLHHVHTELEDVARADFPRRRLLRTLAEPLVVDKCPVAGLGVLEVELAILVPEQSVIAG